jgi:transmembrane sensor
MWVPVAVAAALVVAIGFTGRSVESSDSSIPADYVTTAGQRATVKTRNGMSVVLGPASSLRIAGTVATIEGEALFDIRGNGARTFTVLAKGERIAVLGTTFAVRAYAGDNEIRVAVRTGKVSAGRTVLTAGDVGHVRGGNAFVTRGDIDDVLALGNGVLELRDAPLREAIPDLERWYDARIQIADASLGGLHITGSFPAGSLETLANGLSYMLHVHAERSGRVVTLSR